MNDGSLHQQCIKPTLNFREGSMHLGRNRSALLFVRSEQTPYPIELRSHPADDLVLTVGLVSSAHPSP